MPAPSRPFGRLSDSPWLLLLLTTIFWGGNVPAARLAADEISPMVIVVGRWAIACALLYLFLPRSTRAQWPDLVATHWRWIAGMGAALTVSNTLFFVAAIHTTGLNLAILQGGTPIIVIVGAWLVWRTPIGMVRLAGLAISLYGVLLVATRGTPMSILTIELNVGDLYQFASSAVYAAYALALRQKPPGSAWALFALISVASLITSLPLMAWEYAAGAMILPSWRGLAILLYVSIFTSLLGQLFFMRGVELVGPGRAANFHNMTPVFGALLSLVVLREAPHVYHVIALVLVIGGVYVAERWGKR